MGFELSRTASILSVPIVIFTSFDDEPVRLRAFPEFAVVAGALGFAAGDGLLFVAGAAERVGVAVGVEMEVGVGAGSLEPETTRLPDPANESEDLHRKEKGGEGGDWNRKNPGYGPLRYPV